MNAKHLHWHKQKVGVKERERLLSQKACLVWFTGLSGSGKSTIANALQQRLFNEKKVSYILDGDNVRQGLNKDLDFSRQGREENIRRVGEVACLMLDAGLIVMAAFISPYRKGRREIREKAGERFVEVFVKCGLDECEKRDPKGLYRKARKGEISDFTGVSASYEPPASPEVALDTSKTGVEECMETVYKCLKDKGFLG